MKKEPEEIQTSVPFLNFVSAYQNYLKIRQRYLYLHDWKRPEQNEMEAYISRIPYTDPHFNVYVQKIDTIHTDRKAKLQSFKVMFDASVDQVLESDYLKEKFGKKNEFLEKNQLKYELSKIK